LASKFGAKVIYVEHRYFGKSSPNEKIIEGYTKEIFDELFNEYGDEQLAIDHLNQEIWKFLTVD
jgi:hypothetical protein